MCLGTEDKISHFFLLYFPPVMEVLDHFQSLSFQAVGGPAGQGRRQFSCLGSLGKEQASGCNSSLPVTLPALCMVLLVLFPCGLEEVESQPKQWWSRASQAEFGGTLPRGPGNPFWLYLKGEVGFGSFDCWGEFGPKEFSDWYFVLISLLGIHWCWKEVIF